MPIKTITVEKEIWITEYECIRLRRHDEGAGPFCSMECENLDPDEVLREKMVAFELEEWNEIDKAVRRFLAEIKEDERE